jgi:hypothetical protein
MCQGNVLVFTDNGRLVEWEVRSVGMLLITPTGEGNRFFGWFHSIMGGEMMFSLLREPLAFHCDVPRRAWATSRQNHKVVVCRGSGPLHLRSSRSVKV